MIRIFSGFFLGVLTFACTCRCPASQKISLLLWRKLSPAATNQALQWLARLHAEFWGVRAEAECWSDGNASYSRVSIGPTSINRFQASAGVLDLCCDSVLQLHGMGHLCRKIVRRKQKLDSLLTLATIQILTTSNRGDFGSLESCRMRLQPACMTWAASGVWTTAAISFQISHRPIRCLNCISAVCCDGM